MKKLCDIFSNSSFSYFNPLEKNPSEPSNHSNIYMHICSMRIRICMYNWTKKTVSILSRFVGRCVKPGSMAQQPMQPPGNAAKESSGVKHWMCVGFFHYLLLYCPVQWKYLTEGRHKIKFETPPDKRLETFANPHWHPCGLVERHHSCPPHECLCDTMS